jgi:hypothetical protein
MLILFGKESLFVVSEKDFRKGHPFITYFCEAVSGYVVDKEPEIDKHVIIRYGNESMVKVSYEDYPGMSDKEIEDIFCKINNNYNEALIKEKEVIFHFGRSKLILSKLEYPNINNAFITKIQKLLDDYCGVYTKDNVNSYFTQPIGKYSCLSVNMGDFVELYKMGYYDYADKFKNLIYTIEHIYDPSKPLRTASSVKTDKITNLFTTVLTDYKNGNVKDNYVNDSIGKLLNIFNL